MKKKYRTEKDPTGFLRIIALKDFSDIKKGQRGGLISKEENLSQEGNCWIYYHARVYEDAQVFEDAIIYDNARVEGNAKVYEGAVVQGDAWIKENAEIFGNACVGGNTTVSGSAKICGHVEVDGDVEISGNIKLWSSTSVGFINISIESNKDFIMFIQFITIIESKIAESYIFPSNIKEMISTVNEENYVKNIQIIRQLYGEEI